MSIQLRTVGIIGVGHVGAHCAFSLVTQGIVDKLILVDTNQQKAISERQDLIDSIAYLPHNIRVLTGEYEDLKDCDIVINSTGTITQDQERLSELQHSVDIAKTFVDRVFSSGFHGIFINITNPCDIITRQIWKMSGYDSKKIIGTGTGLDSCRLKSVLAREFCVDPKSVNGFMMGEHGGSQMVPWSQITLNSKPLMELEKEKPDKYGHLDKDAVKEEVKGAGWVTFTGKGATEFGIASTLARLVQIILHDEKTVIPCSTLLTGQYGQHDIFISTPCILGKNGVEEVYEMNLTNEELKEFIHSCETLKKNIELIR